MHSIQIGPEIHREYPESVDEMTQEQYLGFCYNLVKYMAKNISYVKFNMNLVYLFLDVKRIAIVKNKRVINAVAENIVNLSELNDAFFDKDKEKNTITIKSDFLKNPIPSVKIQAKEVFYGPDTALVNTCFGEYVIAHNSFLDYSKSNDEDDLNTMCGALYRPKDKRKKGIDKRVSFKEADIHYYKEKFKTVPFFVKYGIWLWFSSCQKYIATAENMELSGGGEANLAVLFKKGTSNEYNVGMAGVVFELAATGVFGDSEKTKKTNTYEVLIEMSRSYFKAKKQQPNVKNS